METLLVSDLISTYRKFIEEAIQDYAEKNYISSFSAENLNNLTTHLVTYCTDKVAELLLQIPELNNEAERGEEILEEDTCSEQGKCMEPAQIRQSSTGPSEIAEVNNGAERRQEVVEEETQFEQGKCMEPAQIHQSSAEPAQIHQSSAEPAQIHQSSAEPAQIHQSSADPSKIIIDMDQFMKSMTEHHKQQQEFQDKMFKTLLDQRTQQEQNQQQQNRVYEQFLLQQQDFQSKLMGDFVKHIEMQVTLLCQTLSNSKTEPPVHDGHVNVDKKDTSCYKPSSPEPVYQDTGHSSISGRDSTEKLGSFAHFEVANRGKQPFQLFDCHELGQNFCQWFYRLLNSQNPSHGQERLDWSLDIFWNDAVFLFVHGYSQEKQTGDECVSSKLLEMTQGQKLTFTPKLDCERFKCVNSKHGLVVVAVTGVISDNGNYSGVFSQIFGLIKCPSRGIYKIKSIYLKVDDMNPLISGHTFHVPQLQYSTEQLQELEDIV